MSVRIQKVVTILLAVLTVHCASTNGVKESDKEISSYEELQQRLQASEEKNRALNLRLGDLENEMTQTQDRLQAQMLAQRFNRQHRPDPVPESRFSNGMSQGQSSKWMPRYRQSRRISLGGPSYEGQIYIQDDYPVEGDESAGEEIIVTEAEFKAYATMIPEEERRVKGHNPGQAMAYQSSGSRRAQPDVTQERLKVSGSGSKGQSTEFAAVDKVANSRQIQGVSFQKGKGGPAMYEAALTKYRSGNYLEALQQLEVFLRSGPQPSYLDNALYWIGESHFALNRFDKSIHYFKRVLKETPTGNKVPNATLKMAIAYRHLGQEEHCKRLLGDVVRRFPDSGAGLIAKRELQK